MDFDPYVRSLVLWMLGVAVAVYAGKALLRSLPPDLAAAATGRYRVPKGFALFLVGMVTLLIEMDPVHFAGAEPEEVLSRWRGRLPYTAVAALLASIAAGWLDRVGPLRAGFALAWPSAIYAGMAWTAYFWLQSFIPPQDAARITELMGYAGPFLTLVTAYPAAAFATGATGATIGRSVGR